MIDQRLTQVADLLVGQCLEVKEGEKIWVTLTDVVGLPLAEEVVVSVLRHGGFPHLDIGLEHLRERVLHQATAEQLLGNINMYAFAVNHFDKSILVLADANVASLHMADKVKIAQRDRAMEPHKRVISKKPWVLTAYPTPSMAQAAQMGTTELEEFYFRSVLLDWRAQAQKYQGLAERLTDKNIHIVGEDTDLKMSTKGRLWLWDDWKANMPGGEVFTSPVHETVEGKVYFNYPLTRHGVTMRDIRLVFKKGVVVEATASEGEAYLRHLLDLDEGARHLGEVAIGCNPGVTKYMNNVLFDEKMAGTIHMALGYAFPECNGKNISALHMDIIKDMRLPGSMVYAGDQVILREGELV